LSLFELVSIIGVGLGIGLATYFMLESLGKLESKDIKNAWMIPLIIPLVAAGVLVAGLILSQMPTVGLSQLISALGVSLALAPILLSVGFMVKGLKGSKMTDILMVGLAIPVIATGIMLASLVLQYILEISLTVHQAKIVRRFECDSQKRFY